MAEFIGRLNGKDVRIAIVVSRFNETITQKLLEGAKDGIRRLGGDPEAATVAWVPGAFEIPLVAKQLALSGNFDTIICLGAIIRGSTSHFDYVAAQAAQGISRAAMDSGIPVIFGVLTTDTIEQALERSGIKFGNKGFESVQAAFEMVDLLKQLKESGKGADLPESYFTKTT